MGVNHRSLLILENKTFEGSRNSEEESKIIGTLRQLRMIYL